MTLIVTCIIATITSAIVTIAVRTALRPRYEVFDAITGRTVCHTVTRLQARRACESLDIGRRAGMTRIVADYDRIGERNWV